jgi:hypothetical protein
MLSQLVVYRAKSVLYDFQHRPDARYVDIEGLHEIATHPVTHVVLCSIKTDGEMGIESVNSLDDQCQVSIPMQNCKLG